MVKRAVERLDKGLSRRSFLSKAGKVVAGAGVLLAANVAGAPTAEATACCGPSSRCACCTTTPGKCCSGYSYTGYTWSCCYGTRLYTCWDCRRNGRRCHCARATQAIC
jgi:hypothetical protein